MEVTRNVILDLLPLYLSNEANEDTIVIVKKYLDTDPELAEIANKLTMKELPGNAPIPLTREDKMDAYREAKRKLLERTIILAAIISASFLSLALITIIIISFLRG